jgi:hypothetical protein
MLDETTLRQFESALCLILLVEDTEELLAMDVFRDTSAEVIHISN